VTGDDNIPTAPGRCGVRRAHGKSGDSGKTRGSSHSVMAGLVPAIPIIGAPCHPDRDRRDKPGDDQSAATRFASLTRSTSKRRWSLNSRLRAKPFP